MCDVKSNVCEINEPPNEPSVRRRIAEKISKAGTDMFGEINKSGDGCTSKHLCFIEEIKRILSLT